MTEVPATDQGTLTDTAAGSAAGSQLMVAGGATDASTGAPAVVLAGVSKRFGSVTAVDDVTLSLPAGRLVTLLGPSGCGKTTLLRILAGFQEPDHGSVAIAGEDMSRRPPETRPVNLVFQRYALFPNRSVLDNVTFGLESAGVSRADRVKRAREVLTMCHMEGFEERAIDELSGGQAQRVAVARAVVNRPSVLLLDEPLAALDLKLRRHLQMELRRLQRQLGMTFVYVTHDQTEALSISDLIVLMDAGRVVQIAPPRELYDEPSCVFAATFLGEANVLDGTVVSDDVQTARLRVGELALTARSRGNVRVGQSAHICVRPEHLAVTRDDAPDCIPGRVDEVVYTGATARYIIHLRGTPNRLAVEQPLQQGAELVSVDESVGVRWNPEAAIALDS